MNPAIWIAIGVAVAVAIVAGNRKGPKTKRDEGRDDRT